MVRSTTSARRSASPSAAAAAPPPSRSATGRTRSSASPPRSAPSGRRRVKREPPDVIRLADEHDLLELEVGCAREGAPRPHEHLERYLAEQRAGLRLFLVAHAHGAVAG